jgi:hypothetical protein
VFPNAIAGAIFHAAMQIGKFQGVMIVTTPSGSRRVYRWTLALCEE